MGFEGRKRGLVARRRVNDEIANFIQAAINSSGTTGPGPQAHLTSEMAMTVVGGINELVLQAIEQERAGDLRELVAPAHLPRGQGRHLHQPAQRGVQQEDRARLRPVHGRDQGQPRARIRVVRKAAGPENGH